MLDKADANHKLDENSSITLRNSQAASKSFLGNIGLRTKAVVFAIAISTIPVLTIGAVLYSFVNHSRRQEIETAHKTQAKQITSNIKNALQQKLRELGNLPNQGLIINNLREQQEILRKWQESYKINSANNQLFIVGINGNILVNVQNRETENQRDENYFQTVLRTNKPFISQPININNQYYLDFAVPVKDSSTNQTLYIVRSIIPVSYFQNLLTDTTQNNYYVADANGKIFLSNNQQYIGNNIQEIFTELPQIEPSSQELSTKLLNDQDLLTYTPWQPEAEIGNLKWKTLLTTNQTVAFAPVNQLLWKLAIATLLTTLLTGGTAIILARRMISRIINANSILKKLGRGNLQTRMILQGKDELTSLGLNINEMADKLEELLQEQKQDNQQLRLFANTLISIRQPANTENLLNTTVTKIRQVFNADRVAIYRYGLQSDSQVLAESIAPGLLNVSDDIISLQYVLTEPIDTLRVNQSLAINNVYEANLCPEKLYILEQLQVKSKLTVPIFKDNNFFGFLTIHHCHKYYIWQPQEINFTQQLAQQFGISLERIRLLEDSQSLKNLAVHLSTSWKTEDIYNLAVQDIRQALKVDRAVIYKFDENWQGIFIAESVVAGFTCAKGVQLIEPCLVNYVDKYRQGKAEATNNIYQAGLNECYLQQLEAFNVKANLVAPIIVFDKLLGLLIAHQCSKPRNWQQSEIDLFEQFARLLGLSLERADLFFTQEQARVSAEHVLKEQRQQEQQQQAHLMSLLEQIEGAVITKSKYLNDLSTIQDNQIQQISKIATASNTRDEIKTVAKSARLAAQAASNVTQAVTSINSTIDINIENITNLQSTIEGIAAKTRNLEDDIQEITTLATLINEIATQTNLLAINAGIEAARITDARQGFGLVAEEIVALSTKCTNLSNQIETIAHRLHSEASEVVTTVELQTQHIYEGTESLITAKNSFSEITDKCHQIDNLVTSIYGATASQIQASKQVATALKNLPEIDISEYSKVLNSNLEAVEIIKRIKESIKM
jgi:methyl-accepting chemotaxis protein PixJ